MILFWKLYYREENEIHRNKTKIKMSPDQINLLGDVFPVFYTIGISSILQEHYLTTDAITSKFNVKHFHFE